jgi:amicyanin
MKNNKGLVLVVIGLVLVAGLLAAIAFGGKDNTNNDMSGMSDTNMSESSKSSANDRAKAVATDTVSIENYTFSPEVITVKVGTKVTWTNNDSVHHNVVADEASSDAPDGDLIGKGESYSFTFMKAGTFNYHCSPHPYMKGTVIVTE